MASFLMGLLKRIARLTNAPFTSVLIALGVITSMTVLFQNCADMHASYKAAPLGSELNVRSPEMMELPTPTPTPPVTEVVTRPNYGPNTVLQNLSPSIAVRGSGCVMCHANVIGNVMTDLGYGDSYYKNGLWYTNDSQNGNWTSAVFNRSQIFVPKTPDDLAQEIQSLVTPGIVSAVDKVFIGAPSQSRVREIGGLTDTVKSKFLPNRSNSPPLTGLGPMKGGVYYGNGTDPIVCDGDYVVDGTVWLRNAKFVTLHGCRIYSTHSIFVSGPITFSDTIDSQTQNLQLSSAIMVAMGIGNSTGACANSINYLSTSSSLFLYTPYTRNWEPAQLSAVSLADAKSLGSELRDAGCEPGGQSVSFSHLLVNAPFFVRRYTGDQNGAIITELAFSSRGPISTYSFDPIFTKVPTLPLLKPDEYLSLNK